MKREEEKKYTNENETNQKYSYRTQKYFVSVFLGKFRIKMPGPIS